jgi:hypothetical protein
MDFGKIAHCGEIIASHIPRSISKIINPSSIAIEVKLIADKQKHKKITNKISFQISIDIAHQNDR